MGRSLTADAQSQQIHSRNWLLLKAEHLFELRLNAVTPKQLDPRRLHSITPVSISNTRCENALHFCLR